MCRHSPFRTRSPSMLQTSRHPRTGCDDRGFQLFSEATGFNPYAFRRQGATCRTLSGACFSGSTCAMFMESDKGTTYTTRSRSYRWIRCCSHEANVHSQINHKQCAADSRRRCERGSVPFEGSVPTSGPQTPQYCFEPDRIGESAIGLISAPVGRQTCPGSTSLWKYSFDNRPRERRRERK